MEFREFLNLFKKYKLIFGIILATVIIIGFIWSSYQSRFYLGSMAINISRENSQSTEIISQQYDQFYRLQADEKFGDNIVNWSKDLGFIDVVKKEFTQRDDWNKIIQIKATKLSSSYIKVDFKTKDYQSAFLLGKILENKIKAKNQELNSNQKEGWFKLIIDEAYVAKNDFNIYKVFLISLFLGLFLGLFGVLMRHYFNLSTNENRN